MNRVVVGVLGVAAALAGVSPEAGSFADGIRKGARRVGYRFEGEGDSLRCVPTLEQTEEQAARARAHASAKRVYRACRRLFLVGAWTGAAPPDLGPVGVKSRHVGAFAYRPRSKECDVPALNGGRRRHLRAHERGLTRSGFQARAESDQ